MFQKAKLSSAEKYRKDSDGSLQRKVNANAVRIVTVLAPHKAGTQCKHLVGVKASSDAANMDITLIFDDGSEWALNEAELRKLA